MNELEKSLLESGYKPLGEPHNDVKTIYKIFEQKNATHSPSRMRSI